MKGHGMDGSEAFHAWNKGIHTEDDMIIMHVEDAGKADAVRRIAKALGEEILTIGGWELNRTLIGLFTGKDIRGEVKLPPLYHMPDLLVFAGMTEEKLDGFLDAYRATKLAPIALKAVSTKHNSNWTVYELICRLQEEMRP